MADAPQKPVLSTKQKVAGTLGASGLVALAMAVASLKPDEGKRNTTYADIAGVPTICYGHTGPDVKLGQRKTDAECDALLSQDAQGFLRAVAMCVPALSDRPNQWAASTRLAFNIGSRNFCGSTAARRFNAGDWKGGCDAFLMWRNASGRMVPGLLARRQRERAQCMEGLS